MLVQCAHSFHLWPPCLQTAFPEEERDIMARAASAWLTRLHFAFQDAEHLYLAMDYHPGGDLLSLLARFVFVFRIFQLKYIKIMFDN